MCFQISNTNLLQYLTFPGVRASVSGRRHCMEKLPTLLVRCEGNRSLVDSLDKVQILQIFDISFDVSLNKMIMKYSLRAGGLDGLIQFDVNVMRNLTEPDQWFIDVIKRIRLPNLESIAATVCYVEIKCVRDLTDEQGTKPIQYPTNRVRDSQMCLGKEANGIKRRHEKVIFSIS